MRFRVRTLFHKRGENSTQGTCVTLHAFKETEEHKASCITQVRTSPDLLVFSPDPSHLFSALLPFLICPSICPVFQPPLGLCVVTLTLPRDWFENQHTNQSHLDMEKWPSNPYHRRWMRTRERQRRGYRRGNAANHLQRSSPSLR